MAKTEHKLVGFCHNYVPNLTVRWQVFLATNKSQLLSFHHVCFYAFRSSPTANTFCKAFHVVTRYQWDPCMFYYVSLWLITNNIHRF